LGGGPLITKLLMLAEESDEDSKKTVNASRARDRGKRRSTNPSCESLFRLFNLGETTDS